ncbi:GL18044 [Drosophila persimilis]|uniref:GL18044 n=1 Tax=Drosophila persimilis TaxID=7234 RepID=B4H2B6_DROPE|nr:GL18044 [Drosophila persimilis]
MVFVKNWEDFEIAAENMYMANPQNCRYTMKYVHSKGHILLKMTDNVKSVQYKAENMPRPEENRKDQPANLVGHMALQGVNVEIQQNHLATAALWDHRSCSTSRLDDAAIRGDPLVRGPFDRLLLMAALQLQLKRPPEAPPSASSQYLALIEDTVEPPNSFRPDKLIWLLFDVARR